MIKLTRALTGASVMVAKVAITIIDWPEPTMDAGAILTVSGQKLAVRESVDDVLRLRGE